MASQFTNLSFFSVVCSPLRLNLLNPQCLTPKRWADEKRKQFLSTRSLENELVRHSWTLALSEAVVKKKIKSDHSFVACSSHVELRLITNRSEGFRSFCSSVWQRQVLSFARVNEIFLTNRSEHFFPLVAADDIVRRNPHTWPCSHAQQTAVRCVKGSGRPAVTGFNWNLCGSGRNEIIVKRGNQP